MASGMISIILNASEWGLSERNQEGVSCGILDRRFQMPAPSDLKLCAFQMRHFNSKEVDHGVITGQVSSKGNL